MLARIPDVCHLPLLEIAKLRDHGRQSCYGLPDASRIPEDDLPLWRVHEIDEIVVNVGVAETVFPNEGLEVRTGTNGDFMAGFHQCSAQCDIGLNIASGTNRRNQDLHADASLAYVMLSAAAKPRREQQKIREWLSFD